MTQNESTTLAYVNMYGVLGTLENLCDLVPEAKNLLKGASPFSVGFAIRGGPQAKLVFHNGRCELREGTANCTVLLPFSSCTKFNGMINGTYTPIPSKGLTKVALLKKTLIPLTELLAKYLKPTRINLQDAEFRTVSTRLMLYTAAAAVAEIGNHDIQGAFSAGQIPDGNIAVNVKNTMGITINVRNHHLTTIKKSCTNPQASLTFFSLETARQLLNDEISITECLAGGNLEVRGMPDVIENMKQLLDRASQYLR